MRRLFALFLLLAQMGLGPAYADMYQDAGNAKLPEAMTNLLAQPVFIPESKYQPFTIPSFGPCCYQTGSSFTTTGVAHPSNLQATMNIHREAQGSTVFGPATSDVGLFLSAGKTNALTSAIEGEMVGLYLAIHQGRKGDASGFLASATKVKSGAVDDTGGIATTEVAGIWTDTTGQRLWEIHALSAFGATGDVGGNGGHGMFVESFGPDAAVAANRIVPYSAFTAQTYDQHNLCGATPANCFLWQNVLTATSFRGTDPVSIFFQVTGGPTSAGDIRMGSGAPYHYSVSMPTQSLGNRLTLQNVGGDFRILANNGTTPTLKLGQGPSPVLAMQSTTVPVTAGGLWRQGISSVDGSWAVQINTAGAGDFSAAILPMTITPAGGVRLPLLPASAGAAGWRCVSTRAGALYKKAACP